MLEQNRKQILITFILLLNLHVAVAQNSNHEKKLHEQDSTRLSGKIEEVTVTAFRTPYNLLNIPAPVNLISAVQINVGKSFTPVDALNQVPGIYMQHGTYNTNRLTIRGIGSRTPYSTNKIKAYFGEIPLTTGDGETALEDLENQAIERVEIIKGPSSSLYGAGLGGVLLFYPKNVAANFVQHQTTLASFGSLKNTFSAGIIQNRMNIFAAGSLLQSDGFRENNQTNRMNLLLNTQYSFSEKINLQVLLSATKMKAFIPSSIDLQTLLKNSEQAAANWKAIKGYEEYITGQFGVSLNILAADNHKISIGTFGNLKDADELRPFNKLKEDRSILGWRAYIQKKYTGNNFIVTVSSGLEFFMEKYNWSTHSNATNSIVLSDNHEKRSYENLFLQIESGFNNRLFISTGINGNLTRFIYTDKFTANGDRSGKHTYKSVLSPRVGLNYLIIPQLSVFGNISHGFSTPTFEETLLPEGEINTGIKPESGWSYEAGVRSVMNEKLQISVSYFRIYIKNLLVARRTGEDAYIGVNAGESLHPGLETEIKWLVSPAGKYPNLVLSGNTTIADYRFSDFTDEGINYSGNNLPGITKSTWSANGNFSPVKNLGFNFWYRFSGKMPVNDANSDFTKSFGIASFDVKYSGKIKRNIFEIKGGVQNIFNEKYVSMLAVNALTIGNNLPRYYYPGEPVNFYFSVQYRFE